jgi:ethylmalonyl-CoA/methylmalonyl-CoA decarboxylase
MMLDLADIVSDLEAWEEGKGVIVHGAGGTFCSGGDLTLMKAIMCPEKGVLMSALMQDTLTRLYRLPMLSVALIEGAALGGGAEVAVSCDFRVATTDATIGFVQSRMGVSPGWGGGAKLVEQLGRAKALKLLMSAQVLTSQEALRTQLVDEILTQSSHPVDSTKEWMAQYLRAQSVVARVAKGVVVNASQNNSGTVLSEERALFAKVWGGAAQKSAIEGKIRHKK